MTNDIRPRNVSLQKTDVMAPLTCKKRSFCFNCQSFCKMQVHRRWLIALGPILNQSLLRLLQTLSEDSRLTDRQTDTRLSTGTVNLSPPSLWHNCFKNCCASLLSHQHDSVTTGNYSFTQLSTHSSLFLKKHLRDDKAQPDWYFWQHS